MATTKYCEKCDRKSISIGKWCLYCGVRYKKKNIIHNEKKSRDNNQSK